MIPDEDYLQLYDLYCRLLAQHPAPDTQRVVYYHPELFVEMSREILNLRQRIKALQHLEIEYQIKADEVIKLCDKLNQVASECKLRHIKLSTSFNLRNLK